MGAVNYRMLCEAFGLETKYFENTDLNEKLQNVVFNCLKEGLDVSDIPKPDMTIDELNYAIACHNLGVTKEFFLELYDNVFGKVVTKNDKYARRKSEYAITLASLCKNGYELKDLVELMKQYGYKEAFWLFDSAARALDINIIELLDQGYDTLQLGEICDARQYDVDVLPWIDETFTPDQIEQVVAGLADGIDVTEYNDSSIPRAEMLLIREELTYC